MSEANNKAQEIVAENQETEQTPAEVIQEELPAVTLDELEGMNMEVFASQEAPDVPREWRIADDGCADWAVRKIAEERMELARLKELADAEIERIKVKIEAAEKRCENGTRYFMSKLAEYFATVPHKKTKTKHSYRLLSGTLAMKLGGPTLKQDDATLVEYLKTSGNTDMIAITEKPKWGEFKKRLEIVGGQVVDKETGEIVEGVFIEERPSTFSVDL